MVDDMTPCWWSWEDIIRHAARLGIPHFQRGAVWEASNQTALLESVYEKSPCGSFVLWKPQNDGEGTRHGVPLFRSSFGPGSEPMWLVDGQQRTRAMLDIFRQMFTIPAVGDWSIVRNGDRDALACLMYNLPKEHGKTEGNSESNDALWVVALTAMRSFDKPDGAYFEITGESRKMLRGSMFRRLHMRAQIRIDGGREKRVPPNSLFMIPLASLVAPTSVFHDDRLSKRAQAALKTFNASAPCLSELNDLLPWGPQFVTGHAYSRPAAEACSPSPIQWADLSRGDSVISKRVELLAGLFNPEYREVFERFALMLTGPRFAVGWLPRDDVSAAIDAYVRINRAGIRVRAEERALALLSRAYPKLLEELKLFVDERDATAVEDERALLIHESDRHMGFPVWISVLTRYTALALLGSSACRWLGVSAIDKETFGYRLDRVGPNELEAGRRTWARKDYTSPGEIIQECSARAREAILLVDSIMSEELCLDHRMARPSTRVLAPLMDLFYRLPVNVLQEIRNNHSLRAAIARLLRWTMLAPYIDQPAMENLILKIHGLDANLQDFQKMPVWETCWEEEVRQALGRYRAGLAELLPKTQGNSGGRKPENASLDAIMNEWALGAFEIDLNNARSLQHPAVGWLYAIERRGKAKEFLWETQYDGFENDNRFGIPPPPPGKSRSEEPLQRATGPCAKDLYPEKQHIVPFARAKGIVGKGGTRATASPANAIGNLTWLSSRQNALEALSDRWTVMDRHHDAENLKARGMFAMESDGCCSALDLYEKITSQPESESKASHESLFYRFCETRKQWMFEQLREWLEEKPSIEECAWIAGNTTA